MLEGFGVAAVPGTTRKFDQRGAAVMVARVVAELFAVIQAQAFDQQVPELRD